MAIEADGGAAAGRGGRPPLAPDPSIEAFAAALVAADPDGEQSRRRLAEIDTLGERDIVTSSEMTRRFAAHAAGRSDDGARLARDLAELRRVVARLAPSGPAGAERPAVARPGRQARPPADRELDRYFERYARAERRIRELVASLQAARAELEQEAASIAAERRALGLEVELLERDASIVAQLDASLERRIGEIEVAEAARATRLREDVLFTVRRRHRDLLTQLAIAEQGYLALGIVLENGHAVSRAVRSATATTLAALRTAVVVAGALAAESRAARRLQLARAIGQASVDGAAAILGGAHPADAAAGTAGPEAPGGGERGGGGGVADVSSLRSAWQAALAALAEVDAARLQASQALAAGVQETRAAMADTSG